jgi:ABC-2 type transport system ATP-binding protein
MSPTSVSARIDAVLRQTGMDKAAGRRLSKYSKGMLQRIGLAQTLLNDPQLLILDEPMSGLDPMGRREVRELLLDLKAQGKTIILSSHIVPDVEMLADSVVVLREGSLVLDRDLTAAAHQSSYELKLHDPATPGFTRSITAHSIEALREVLDRCHTDGVQVMGVEPRRSGLEEIFLEAHNSSEVNS